MAGFGAVHRLHAEGVKSVLFEKMPYHGGHTASHTFSEGFTLDQGPHVSFTKDERIKKLLAESVDHKYEKFDRAIVNNYWKGHWITHPAQCNLYGLPEDLLVNILRDFVEAKYSQKGPIDNYGDWLLASFGKTFAETFPMEYGLKYHTTTAQNMSTDWIGPRLYQANLEEVLRGALSPASPDVHYVEEFRYPTSGGFVSYLKMFRQETEVRVSHKMVRVNPKSKEIRFENGVVKSYDHMISSIPLPELIPLVDGVPKEVLEASRKLACTDVVLVTIGVERPDLLDAHWTYIYNRDVIFTRLSTPHLQSRNNAPPGCGCIMAECYYSKKYKPLDRKPEECIDPVIRDLERIGLLREDDKIIFRNALHVNYANVIFDLERADAVSIVHGYLDDLGIAYCGRYGEWKYIWTDQSFMSGENAAQKILDRIST